MPPWRIKEYRLLLLMSPMNREQYLRNLILDKYPSLRQFALEAEIPYSSLMTILSRGIGGASFDVVMQICQKLRIEPSALTEANR